MGLKKLNCWEVMQCGKEPGGRNADTLGVCKAATDVSFDGINGGKCAGRFCWAVAGTLCGENRQGSFAEKRDSCLNCRFYQRVLAEESVANLRNKFLRFILPGGQRPLIPEMTFRHIPKGERFITQGDVGDQAFVIQRGSCIVVVEKTGELHPIDHRGEGDIVGMMSLLTGERRHAHVEAETDMDVRVIDQKNFDAISSHDPDMMMFLTELVADRFDSRRPTADRTIGKYIAADIIGRGGYGIVYKGKHAALNMPVVIKMMRHHLAMDEAFSAIFHNEAQIIAGLKHENIVRVYDIEERYRTLFIIMEYLEGESLKHFLERHRALPPAIATNFLMQICSGLDYAHQKGIIHRDINTSNVIIQPNDRIKILDFGLACPIGTEDFSSAGTLLYMAPEQIESHALDQRTDIYALGITAYEMVTGIRPFPEDDLRELKNMRLNREIPDPAERVPDLPGPLREFIIKACRRDPEQRYRTAAEAIAALSPSAEAAVRNRPAVRPENADSIRLTMNYHPRNRSDLNDLLKEFQEKARGLGIQLKVERRE
ncbi:MULTISPECIES: protein kinase domain-containing protein [Desulfococcus]|uniref:Cyclic nucleotide-binding protein n=1 Tax=Desulfococcus multivorans DSM 2059 TaxID=1121405 RepID=S7TUS7_DESML|nr:protein kinase [Desulfococcus multivorans]AOY57051.1 serine/threonine kinase [Desulfococcus multivorans]AQU99566.1 serine/threonine protein kinase [Desulfococcus multivorans]EPR40751.1 cyclic nucleotide-binding protein [Desulfococcus multivorans DSM 2059]SJZ88731.1 Serine/threonine protein kinase [Desulfococcus multivorans DSM 2059]